MGFTVRRTSRSYVRPSAATPSGTLELSIIDRVVGLRHLVRSLHVFAPVAGRQGSPARVIREALGKALVDYYPLAGRFVDGPGGPASARVECTGEGAWFVEAAAGCSLDDVGRLDQYPFVIPEDDLLPDAAPGVEPLDLPLMMQVTEFSCGGFVVGLISCHAMADGLGAAQFINAVGDYARGLPKPRVSPIWARDLVPNPPKLSSAPPPFPRMFQFRHLVVDLSVDSINKVKSQFLQSTGQRCSSFDVAIAKVWQARTRSLRLADPSTLVKLFFFANTRHLMRGGASAATAGFYGNCFYTVTVSAESGAVEGADVAGVVAMIRDPKARLPAEFAQWAAGELVEKDPYELSFTYESLFVSDWTRLGFLEADYGWGTPSQVIPFAYHPFMPIAIIGAPPVPKAGARIMARCVEEENLPEFKEEMKAFQK
ncbi:10-deacetylbaccatin III 10-O-acetyltransferase [Dichanthelium oligosanthes]|uniref:10-deacetylbaccatin III 10-O-acetyltransferase n=1 Tax=Dichanthelium oligosanthes TaxID=888268 RepID=A0A1E5W3L1_9POAL|nr:10-deacetylbaccatin III 10-O-acetyltransferase [Dichanthelium oligosanthes]